jgi:hypothetical protein
VILNGYAPLAQHCLDAGNFGAGLADAVGGAGRGVGLAEFSLLIQIVRESAAVGGEPLLLLLNIFG